MKNIYINKKQCICSSVEEFAVNAPGHHIKPLKIQPGVFNSYYTLIDTHDFTLMVRQVEYKYAEAGEFKKGTIGTAFLSDGGEVIYNGSRYKSTDKLVTNTAELDSILSTNLRMISCFINESRLKELFNDEETEHFYQARETLQTRRAPANLDLRQYLNALTLNIYNNVLDITNEHIYRDLVEDLYYSFYNHVTENTLSDSVSIKPKHRLRLLKKALNYINDHDINQVNVADIADYVHTSQRNLQKLFKQYLDTTPKAYIQRKKMNSMHELLLDADPQSLNVKDLFKSFGIRHMGNFSKEYYNFFGEYPKQTLKRLPNHSF